MSEIIKKTFTFIVVSNSFNSTDKDTKHPFVKITAFAKYALKTYFIQENKQCF